LVTGPLWGKPVWGIWWTWDARLTTTLVLWLIYVSYLLVRRFAAGSEMRTLAAVLSIFGALDMPINYLANRLWRTQHPAPVFGGDPDSGIKDPHMLAAFGWNVLAWAVWGLLVLTIRVYIERRQQKIECAAAQAALVGD
jgi:heme exporter protein C